MGDPYEFPVELGKVREFARATKARLRDDVRQVVPLTFPVTSVAWSSGYDELVGRLRNLTGLQHAEQEFVFPDGPVAVGETLIATERVESVDTQVGKRGWAKETRVVLTEFHDRTGKLVTQMRATLVSISRSGEKS